MTYVIKYAYKKGRTVFHTILDDIIKHLESVYYLEAYFSDHLTSMVMP